MLNNNEYEFFFPLVARCSFIFAFWNIVERNLSTFIS